MPIVKLPDGALMKVPEGMSEDAIAKAVESIEVDWADVDRAADEVGVDKKLYRGLIQHESGGRKYVTGDGGAAVGPGQLHPEAAADVGLSPDERWNPRANLLGSAAYLRKQLDTFKGDEARALAAYNQGAGATGEALEKGRRYAAAVQLKARGPRSTDLVEAPPKGLPTGQHMANVGVEAGVLGAVAGAAALKLSPFLVGIALRRYAGPMAMKYLAKRFMTP